MSSSRYSHTLGNAVGACALGLLLVLALSFASFSVAFADPETSEAAANEAQEAQTTQLAVSVVADQADTALSDHPLSETISDQVVLADQAPTQSAAVTDKSRHTFSANPKIEITTSVVTLEPSDAVIAENATPLATFDTKPCFIHLLMIIGIAITVGYTFFVSRRIRKHSVRLEAAASKVTGSRLDPSSVPVSMPSPQPMNTPAGVER